MTYATNIGHPNYQQQQQQQQQQQKSNNRSSSSSKRSRKTNDSNNNNQHQQQSYLVNLDTNQTSTTTTKSMKKKSNNDVGREENSIKRLNWFEKRFIDNQSIYICQWPDCQYSTIRSDSIVRHIRSRKFFDLYFFS